MLQNLETLVQTHQVTNKLPDPRISIAIKKVLGALVGVEWEKRFFFFVIRGSVAWWSERRSGSQEPRDLTEAPGGPAERLQANFSSSRGRAHLL